VIGLVCSGHCTDSSTRSGQISPFSVVRGGDAAIKNKFGEDLKIY